MSTGLQARATFASTLAGAMLGVLVLAPAPAAACANASFRAGPSEHLPDCRVYEQVSPVEKAGLDAATLAPQLPAQSSACEGGEKCTIAYMNADGAFDGAPGNDVANAYLATRTAEGWQTTPLTPPTPEAPASSFARVTYAFSGDLSQAVLRVPLQQLTADAPAGVYNLFVRQASGGYSLVTASAPAQPPQPDCGRCFERQDVPVFAGASEDFAHVLFEANDSLVEGAPAGAEDLYETVAEHVRLVGILPDGTIAPQGASAGGQIEVLDERTGELEHAVSEDGSQVVFQARADGGPPDPQQQGETELYDRIDAAASVEISAPAPGAQPDRCETTQGICAAEPARFWAASADGSLVYFTSKAALSRASNTGSEVRSEQELEEAREREEEGLPEAEAQNPGEDLYRYDVDTRTLSDLTVDTADQDGADVLGVVGASSDGSHVYFVAEGELADGATPGQPNLYLWDGGPTPVFIATLKAPDEAEEAHVENADEGEGFRYRSDVQDWTRRPTLSQAYVTPDGEHLAFMSVEPLTNYDNEAQASGEAVHEVFEYSAETGQITCASCDANGAPPLGSAFIGAGLGERASTPFHQPRSVSDDGSRLFFSSPDPLVPGLAGGSTKLFEYEDGAVQLISGTEGGSDAVFLDASASGDDVFFATRERLAPSDTDELVDVYDARVDGGLPAPPVIAPCQASACREPFSLPGSFAVPASAAFAGPGNLAPPPPAKPTRKQLLARALASCRRKERAKRRAACIAAARRRYQPKATKGRHGASPERRSTSR